MESYELARAAAKALSQKKAGDIVILNVSEQTVVCSYFVIASGRSTTHTRSLVERVEEELEKEGVSPKREEGVKEGRWAVIDYGDVIVHVFNDETRLLYHLENLWGDDGNVKKY